MGVNSFFKTCVGIDTGIWTDFAKERMRFPIKNKGCGLRDAVDCRRGQFLEDMLQSIMPLMDRTDKDNCAIKDRLNISTMTKLLGEGLFDHHLMVPWETLLTASTQSSNLANGLR